MPIFYNWHGVLLAVTSYSPTSKLVPSGSTVTTPKKVRGEMTVILKGRGAV